MVDTPKEANGDEKAEDDPSKKQPKRRRQRRHSKSRHSKSRDTDTGDNNTLDSAEDNNNPPQHGAELEDEQASPPRAGSRWRTGGGQLHASLRRRGEPRRRRVYRA